MSSTSLLVRHLPTSRTLCAIREAGTSSPPHAYGLAYARGLAFLQTFGDGGESRSGREGASSPPPGTFASFQNSGHGGKRHFATPQDPARVAGARFMSSTTQPSSTSSREVILRRRRHLPSSPHPQGTPNATRFILTTRASVHGQTEVDRHFHGALTCIHRILGDVPYGRTRGGVSRTPIQMLPDADGWGGRRMVFKVFNVDGSVRERLRRELMAVEGIDGVVCEEGDGV